MASCSLFVETHWPAAHRLRLGEVHPLPQLKADRSSTLRCAEPSASKSTSTVTVYCAGRDTVSTRLSWASAKPLGKVEPG